MSPVFLVKPRRFFDDRGWFVVPWSRQDFAALGIDQDFAQDNHSFSRTRGTLRGLHFQKPPCAQAKLVRCTRGEMFDVIVDLRRGSPTFGRNVSVVLSEDNGLAVFIPVGFAHGFMTLTDDCEVQYKASTPYAPAAEDGLRWDDVALGIDWPSDIAEPILAPRDRSFADLAAFEVGFPYDGNPLDPTLTVRTGAPA